MILEELQKILKYHYGIFNGLSQGDIFNFEL